MARYREVFLEEATDHLEEMSRALLELEKEGSGADAVDVLFRHAHSIKGMAASLEYASITELAHVYEDRMVELRAAGGSVGGDLLALLFKGLRGIERMVEAVRETGEAPPGAPDLVTALAGAPVAPAAEEPRQKKS